MRKCLFLIFSLVLISLSGCSMKEAVRKMSLELKQVRIKNFSNSGFSAVAYMQVTNPNWFGIDVADMRYAVLINDREVASGRLEREVKIPGNGAVVAELPLDVGAAGFESLFGDILKERLTYRVKGEVVFKTMLGSYTMPFDEEKKPKKKSNK